MNKFKKIRAARKRNDEILKPLLALHPATFSHWGNPCTPLKVGIYKDLIERYPTISRKRLNAFLHAYTHTHRYLAAVALRVCRIDLDGHLTECISDRDVESAHRMGAEKFSNWQDIVTVETRFRRRSQAAE